MAEAPADQKALERVGPALFLGAVGAVFISTQLTSHLFVAVLLWVFLGGALCAYVFLGNLPSSPHMVAFIKSKGYKSWNRANASKDKSCGACVVCGSQDCLRHQHRLWGVLNPWEGLDVPESVDKAITEFLEETLNRFIYVWKKDLIPDENFVDEVRILIRHAVASFVQRAKQVDIPKLVTGQLLHSATAHVHTYLHARRKLPKQASMLEIEEAAMEEINGHLHTAVRGTTASLRYFRHLVGAVLPLLLPPKAVQSFVVRSFLQELFAAKVLSPAMDKIADPDFVDKVILVIFDPHTRMEVVYGPPSRSTPLLARFAQRRATPRARPLSLDMGQLLQSQRYLYPFMQYMKSQGTVHVLQTCLLLDELMGTVRSEGWESHASSVVGQLRVMYSTHAVQDSNEPITFSPALKTRLEEVLLGEGDDDDLRKCEQLRERHLIESAHSEVFKLLEETYCPRFHQSLHFYEMFLGPLPNPRDGVERRPAVSWDSPAGDKRKRRARAATTSSTSSDQKAFPSPSPPPRSPPAAQPPSRVQVVDWECHSDGMWPYAVYVIVSWREGKDGKPSSTTVKRRFKEFLGLDAKLRLFYGDIDAQLPHKKSFRNMESEFVEERGQELQQYLVQLTTIPKVQASLLFTLFLTDDSDPAFFLPDTMAGKMMKSIPGRSKKEHSAHVNDLLLTFQASLKPPPPQSHPQTRAQVSAREESNCKRIEQYQQEMADDLSSQEGNKKKPWLRKSDGCKVPMEVWSVMDLVVYMAMHVYRVPQWQLVVLLCVRKLGQGVIETFLHHFISRKVDLLMAESRVVDLIQLLHRTIFTPSTPRTAREVVQRQEQALRAILRYPPEFLVDLLGSDQFMEGTSLVFEGLQSQALNKQLFFTLLDHIVLELFPELQEQGWERVNPTADSS